MHKYPLFPNKSRYVWVYDYTCNYLLRYILPFFALAILSLRTSFFLTPGRKDDLFSRIVTTQGLVLTALLSYAPFIGGFSFLSGHKIFIYQEQNFVLLSIFIKLKKHTIRVNFRKIIIDEQKYH